MTPHAALIELLARVGAQQGTSAFITAEELSRWPTAAVAAMKSQGLLARARPASSMVCPGCEQQCVMPVHTPPATSRGAVSFIVCDKRSDINRVPVSAEGLKQWRCTAAAVCGFVATSLGLRPSDQHPAADGLLNVGMARGDKRTQMLCLRADADLTLVVANNAMPLAELVGYRDGEYSVDAEVIRQLVDSAVTADPRYTPSNARREVGKLDTQEMYATWQRAYRELKKQRRNMSDVWYSQQIARRSIAEGRSADTIRKHMK